jgi:hypothetical protein
MTFKEAFCLILSASSIRNTILFPSIISRERLASISGWKSEQPFFPPLIHQRRAKKIAILSAGLRHVGGLFNSFFNLLLLQLIFLFAHFFLLLKRSLPIIRTSTYRHITHATHQTSSRKY